MTNFLEELYYGNVDPQVRGYRKGSHNFKVSKDINELEEKLTERLQGEDKALFLDDFAEQTPTAATVVDARSTEYGGRQREIHHDVANGVFMPFILHNKPPMLWYGRTVA